MDDKKLIIQDNYINGTWHSSDDRLKVFHKYSQELLAEISLANSRQVENAIQASVKAFEIFKNYSAEKRANILENLYIKLEEQAEEFARLIAAEGGKPISYARSEVSRALDNLRTGIREIFSFSGKQIPMDYLNGTGKLAYTLRVPIGPIVGITPFNFPLNLALHKLIPAIATGCSIILKPAPQAPLTLLAFAKLLEQTDLPQGAVNILMTNNENAQKLIEDDRLKILSFTGSDKVGWMLNKIAGKKKVLLEMGGNAAAIVDESVNLQRAARKLVYGSFLNAGQICISTQRIYVLENVFDEFIKHFIKETKKVKSGDLMDEEVINSSMISRQDLFRIKQWVDEAVEKGGQILCGGQILDEKANIFAPTILTNTTQNVKVNTEEAFAPVVVIEKIESFARGIELVNDSRYGLQAGVFTNRVQHIFKAQNELDVGGVIINDAPGFRIDSMPYGGVKDSGIGREGVRYVMEEFTEPRLVVINPL